MKKYLIGSAAILIVVASLVFFFKEKNKPELRVYAYSTFTALWGPGPELESRFEKICDCDVKYFDAADSRLLFQRVEIEGESQGVDVILGIDQLDINSVSEKLKFIPIDLQEFGLVDQISITSFPKGAVPFDWGALAFNIKVNSDSEKLKSFEDLLKPEWKKKFSLQDPRTSSPGLQFLAWVIATMGEDKAWPFLKSLASQWHSASSSWSTAYGFFDKGEVDSVFSYTTSPIYHEVEEGKVKSKLADFGIPFPMQVEFAGVTKYCRNCELAENFLKFLLEKENQKLIMQKNYMFPVVAGVVEGTAFEAKLGINTQLISVSETDKLRWMEKWTELLRTSGQ